MCEELDIKLNTIPDWNCCSASIGFAGGGALAFSEPEKSQALIKDIIEAAYDGGLLQHPHERRLR